MRRCPTPGRATHHAAWQEALGRVPAPRARVELPGLPCALWLSCSESHFLAHTPGVGKQHFTLLGHHWPQVALRRWWPASKNNPLLCRELLQPLHRCLGTSLDPNTSGGSDRDRRSRPRPMPGV